MKKISVFAAGCLLYLALANLTGWVVAASLIHSFPFRISGKIQPTLLLGTTPVRDVRFSPTAGVDVRIRSVRISYNALLLLAGRSIPLTLKSQGAEITSQEGIGGLSSIPRIDFDSAEASLQLGFNRKMVVEKILARGPQMNVQGQGEINLHRASVDIQLRVEAQSAFLAQFSPDAQEALFKTDGSMNEIVLDVRGSLAHPAIQVQSDLVQVSIQ